MPASGVNWAALNDDTFQLWEVGGSQIDLTVVSVNQTSGDVVLAATVNSQAGDNKDLQLITGASAPIDNAGNRHATMAPIDTTARAVPDPPADDQVAPTVTVVTEPTAITSPGVQTLTWTLKITDTD